jgi:5-methylcytosine-specific restriction protein B
MSFPSNIEREHLLEAIQKIDLEGVTSDEESNYYDVKYGDKYYPPKLVVSFANIFANGSELDRNSFDGGIGTPCFKLLEKHGFEIFTKELEEVLSPDEVRKYISHFKDDYLLEQFFQFAGEVFQDCNFSEADKRIAFTLRKNGKWISLNVGRKLILAVYRSNGENHFCYYVSENDVEWASALTGFKKAQAFGTKPPARLLYFSANTETLLNIELLVKVRSAVLDWLPSVDSSGQPERHNRLLFRLLSDDQFRKDFFQNKPTDPKPFVNEQSRLIESFTKDSANQNLNFSTYLTKRYIASLGTKPFVIFTGLSGSGKTKLAQTFAKWICASDTQYNIIPVGADWTNREPLLGYPNSLDNSKYVLPDNGALDLILAAIENSKDKELKDCNPYFLILDEMNLSHVERYFADFLSAMESKEPISLYSGNERKDENGRVIPQSIVLPSNLFIVGTVNIDETTYMFSPKVLDRANTIEFKVDVDDMKDFFGAEISVSGEEINGKGVGFSSELMGWFSKEPQQGKDRSAQLMSFFRELQGVGAEFGYRTAGEMVELMNRLDSLGMDATQLEDALDVAVMQKLLPKLHGSRSKLSKVIPILISLCLDAKEQANQDLIRKLLDDYPQQKSFGEEQKGIIKLQLSIAKLSRMHTNAIENGFASFAEG